LHCDFAAKPFWRGDSHLLADALRRRSLLKPSNSFLPMNSKSAKPHRDYIDATAGFEKAGARPERCPYSSVMTLY
jgi:hypothetical protein